MAGRERANVAHLGHFELDSPGGLSIGDGEVGCERRVTYDGSKSITVLVRQPVAEPAMQNIRRVSLWSAMLYKMKCSLFAQIRVSW